MKSKLFAAALTALVAASPLAAQNLTGAGATFPNPIYSRWFSEYSQQNANVESSGNVFSAK